MEATSFQQLQVSSARCDWDKRPLYQPTHFHLHIVSGNSAHRKSDLPPIICLRLLDSNNQPVESELVPLTRSYDVSYPKHLPSWTYSHLRRSPRKRHWVLLWYSHRIYPLESWIPPLRSNTRSKGPMEWWSTGLVLAQRGALPRCGLRYCLRAGESQRLGSNWFQKKEIRLKDLKYHSPLAPTVRHL